MAFTFIIGASQQKRKQDFFPMVAPVDFDPTAQPLNIYSVFKTYNSSEATARYIFSFTSSINTLTLPNYAIFGITGYRWGETISGVDYVHDVVSGTAFTAGSTKRYVIVKTTSATNYASFFPLGSVWIYIGNGIISSFGTAVNNTYLKYIHLRSTDCVYSFEPLNAFYNTGATGLTGVLTLPTSVTTIPNQCFGYAPGLTGTLTIPDWVTSVGFRAFCYCTGFTAIDLGEGLQTLPNYGYNTGSGIDNRPDMGAFTGCTNIVWSNPTLPNSLTIIGAGSFLNCTNITGTLTLGNNTQRIGHQSFTGTGISGGITFPSTITWLGGFYNCTGLTGTLTIPTNVTTIGFNAFRGCTGFTGNLTIPNSVTTIWNQAFYGANNITGTLSLGTGLVTLYQGVFQDTKFVAQTLTLPDSLVTIDGDVFWNTYFNGTLTIPNNVTYIGSRAFSNMLGITGLSLGTSVQTLYGYTLNYRTDLGSFSGCTNMTGTLTLPNSLVTIGYGTFYGCAFNNSGLTIPNSVVSIYQSAFGNCTSMTGTLTIGSGVTRIDPQAFWYDNFNNISSSSSNFPVSDNVLYDIYTSGQVKANYSAKAYSGTLTLRNDTTHILPYCFYNNTNRSGSLTLPNTLVSFGEFSFYGCTGFTGTLTIPTSVTTMEQATFSYCSGLTGTLTIPNTLPTNLTNGLFQECTGITGLVLPNNVVSIGIACFAECSGLNGTTITLPSTVTTIQLAAFRSINPARVDSYPNTQPVDIGYNFSINGARVLHVPSGSSSYNSGIWANSNYFVQPITKDL